MKEYIYKSKSSSAWEGAKALLLNEVKNLGGDVIAAGKEITILNKSEKRMFQGMNLNAYKFDIAAGETIIYGVHCSNLRLIKDGH
ncbi:hypothetical protein FHS04_002815 [Mesoflavibacter sabulilitoris]|uniref:Uncharacterized protein n=1 Tax=Mesoflavibacter zeaxanthinifaciens subsp. sabulilitoris TaxID=1520893 RepID=A0A2T1NNP6_9FLAO|nr:hypothetical protein [Mesoflavibacter zeaxanthinifaciens]MBB3125271.1 hypothetical protein [Mesoflavibacter zeaxanthinifaciens subsp. sabulilitoris]PSG94506.1 hypothetical protein C7H61_00805 [Mesoflavibacter zeaxanthinifaciens subsp. sabulilitoris]